MCTQVLNVRLWILVRRGRSTLVGHFTLGSHLFSQDTFLSSHHGHVHLRLVLADSVGDNHVGLGKQVGVLAHAQGNMILEGGLRYSA